MIQIIYVTDAGREIAQRLLSELPESHLLPAKAFVSNTFSRNEALIFIGDMGVCVRTIAPFMKSKRTDPDVICVDSSSNYVISVLSGRIGGANKLTRRIARILGSVPIITTESDNEGFWGLDTLAPHFGWQEEHRDGRMNHIIFHFVNGRPTVLKLDVRGGRGVDYLKRTKPAHVSMYDPDAETEAETLLLAVSPFWNPTVQQFSKSVLYRPPVLHLGIDCLRDCPAGELPRKIRDLMHQHNLSEKSIATIDTTAQCADEMLVQSLLMAFPWAKLSVHELDGFPNPREIIYTEDTIPIIVKAYLEQMTGMAEKCDYDVLGHVTYLFRFFPENLADRFKPESFLDLYKKLYLAVISRGKGIEVNCSGLRMPSIKNLMPSAQLLHLYKELGGSVITVGSDGHSCRSAFSGITEGYRALIEAGFKAATRFEKRNALFYSII